MQQQTEVLTWQMFGDATQSLARAVIEDGYQPDFILAIARGGLFAAGALGYALNVKLLHTVNIEFYTGREERLEMPVMLPPIPDPNHFQGLKVLICDDVADTGETLRTTHEFVGQYVAEVRSLVIYEKSRSIIKPEYVWKQTDDWIHFPWDERVELNTGDAD